MILADTSAWIEYDRATASPVDQRMVDLVASHQLATTEPVVAEVLLGADDPRHRDKLERLLTRHHLYPFISSVDFAAATEIYHQCRRAGFTPRGLIDCMIAAVAWRTNSTLLCRDRDLAQIAAVAGIALDDASA